MASNKITKDVLEAISCGNHSAFNLFYKVYHPVVLRVVKRYIKTEDLVGDVVQEIFAKIWTERTKLIDVLSLESYLFIVVKNYTLNYLHKIATDLAQQQQILARFESGINSVDQHVIDKEYQVKLQEILDRLPAQTKRVFELCRVEGKSYEESSKMLGVSKSAIKKHMIRCVSTLKKYLQHDLHLPLVLFLTLESIL
ncbi:sigma-70 family RNA polymerase sigma factor [Olivibacter sp. LS-1]|uniref:RNA polymerase sigma factor n=1 Tax=Olivibacter sp. LS-1 TaxID=2592345 RepID=UPI0011EB2FF8|nr:sigma-70 family RNA polymerase sigma factor [Olivibacter sp. LS-1]QEL02633.1 sigma-70 family RNA polymerase sigma factor [Olivibacter sp. LS-1]